MLKKDYPNLWEELRKFSQCKNICSKKFKYNMTFEQVEEKVDLINNQISLFDLLGEQYENK